MNNTSEQILLPTVHVVDDSVEAVRQFRSFIEAIAYIQLVSSPDCKVILYWSAPN